MESPLEIPEEEFHAADAWITVCANWAVGRSECFLARRGMEDDCLLPGLLHDVLRESISDILQGRVIPPLTGQWLSTFLYQGTGRNPWIRGLEGLDSVNQKGYVVVFV